MGTRKFDASDSGGCFKQENRERASSENERKKSREEKKKKKKKRRSTDGLISPIGVANRTFASEMKILSWR
jgi:hypothetical protein